MSRQLILGTLLMIGASAAFADVTIQESTTAFCGVDGIPSGWLAKLTMREFITAMADSLLALSEIAPDAH